MKPSFSPVDKKELAGHNLILLVWADELLLRNALGEILTFHEITPAMKGINYKEIYAGRNTKVVEIIELCDELPFLGGRRVVHLRDVDKLAPDELYNLRKYLPVLPEHSILILSHIDKKKSKKKKGAAKKKPVSKKPKKTGKVNVKESWENFIKKQGGMVDRKSVV